MAHQTRKYQPKRLTARHEAILRSMFTGSRIQDVAKRFEISKSQVGRIANSELGRAFLAELNRQATEISARTWAGLMVYDMVAAQKPHLLNLR